MLPRTLEPEVMDSAEEAADYDAMDHREVNRRFAADLWASLGPGGSPGRILDIGSGTALILIELASQRADAQLVGVDLAQEMLKLGRMNVARAGFKERIELVLADARRLPWSDGAFGCVISNSIVHHIPEPLEVLAEMRRVLAPGGLLFVRDLLRPQSAETIEQLVLQYAGQESARQQQLFRQSLHAALTLDEVEALAHRIGMPPGCVRATSDRHWTLCGRTPSANWSADAGGRHPG